MFREGDKIVCINIEGSDYDLVFLERYKIYTTSYMIHINNKKNNYLKIVGLYGFHQSDRFISLKEYRKQKLDKISK